MTVCREALALRAWALEVLQGATPPPPAATAESWRVFLLSERCALPLRARLEARGPFPPAVAEAAQEELKRILSVQAVLRFCDRALGRAGQQGVALKGGVPLAAGSAALHLEDLDLLVRPEGLSAFLAELDREGLSLGKTADEDTDEDAPGGWERAVRHAAGTAQVEVHTVVPFVGEGLQPWEGAFPTPLARVLRPAPRAHLWHVLVHTCEHHPERIGRLRDLLLLRAALAESAPGDLAAVRDLAARHRRGFWILALLDAAAGPAAEDPFRAHAALRYDLVQRFSDGADARRALWLTASAYGLLEGRGEYRRLWFGSARSAWGKGRGSLERRAPALARVLRLAWRGALLAAFTPTAWRAARGARRLARGAS